MNDRCRHPAVLQGVDEIVHADHTALIVVDVQNDFAHSEGFIAKFGLNMRFIQSALPVVNEAITVCRERGIQVIYLQEWISKHTILPNFISQFGDFDHIAVRADTWGAEFHPDLVKPEPGEPVIRKPCYDGFQDTNLDVTLRSLGIRTCVYAGFASNVCVESTARHGFVQGYYTVLLSDASAAGTEEEHNACQSTFKVFYGPVMTLRELVTTWDRTLQPAAVKAP
jgi:nicotinamidase-related amidase